MYNTHPIKLTDIWRTCNKIRAATFRLGFDLRKFFEPLDPRRNNLISAAEFISVLGGGLRGLIGLTHREVADIADYFRVQDGRILYAQLCDVLQGEHISRPISTPCFDGSTEGKDTIKHQRCKLTHDEERRLKVILSAIASRKLVLRPYFQDYEMVAKNDGLVTFAHFARTLSFVGVVVSPEDLNLLMRRFVSDSCSVDYEEFICEVAKAAAEGCSARHQEVNANPERIINTSVYETPSKVQLNTDSKRICECQDPVGSNLTKKINLEDIMKAIQHHVLIHRIRLTEFFQKFDEYNSGKITRSQFIRGLDTIGVGQSRNVSLDDEQVNALCQLYVDRQDDSRVCWRTFADDVDHVFSIKNLERHPDIDVEALLEGRNVKPEPNQRVIPPTIRRLIESRSVDLRPFFSDFDYHRLGRVSNEQLLEVLLRGGLRYPIEGLEQLEENFKRDGAFDYLSFLQELDHKDEPLQVMKDFHNTLEAARWPEQTYEEHEKDIGCVMAYIKNKVSQERISLQYFFEQHDPLNSSVISREDFSRAISSAGVKLTSTQLDTVMDIFASPMRRECVDYFRFCRAVDECFYQQGLEQDPLLIPVQHLASEDIGRNFLSHPERALLTSAMEKLAATPDVVSNISELFSDSDSRNCGSISQSQFKRNLDNRNMLATLDPEEIDVVCKRFAVHRGSENEVDYRAFSKALDILHPVVKKKHRRQCC